MHLGGITGAFLMMSAARGLAGRHHGGWVPWTGCCPTGVRHGAGAQHLDPGGSSRQAQAGRSSSSAQRDGFGARGSSSW